MQPIGGNNCRSSNQKTGIADAIAGDFARSDKAPTAFHRFMRRNTRYVSSAVGSNLRSNKVFYSVAVTIVCIMGGSAWFVNQQNDELGMMASLSSQAGFEASKLVVNGNKNLDMGVLKTKLATQLGGSLFDFNVDEARQHVMSSPWVKSVEVRKVYPDTVVVELVERKPVALWKADGVVNIISAEGTVIAEAELKHMRLPQVVGRGANNVAADFLSYVTRFTDITAKARAYVRVADRRWNIHLDDGPKIMLPEQNWKAALNEVNELNFKKQVFERDIVQIDMRLPDRLVLKMSSEQAKIRKTAIEEALKKKWHKI